MGNVMNKNSTDPWGLWSMVNQIFEVLRNESQTLMNVWSKELPSRDFQAVRYLLL